MVHMRRPHDVENYSGPPPPPTKSRKGEESAPKDLVALASPEWVTNKSEFKEGLRERKTRDLRHELTYLQDPLKLAENTVNLLRKDDDAKALEIVRLASKATPCSVSWNHIIDYQMSKGKVQLAEKIYNEMKKRAQKPDAQTYTILLRGLAWHAHFPQTLPRALKIYYSMFAETCPIKPNIIHTNAMLNVCAQAKDLDALFGVAAKLPTKGPGAPNNLTYTTIINAIRNTAWRDDDDLKDETLEQKSLRRQRAVMQGRRLWEDIILRWREGDIWIDEELVCAMGRLLLLGSTERDYEDVLSLAEQVMAIPRQKRGMREPKESTGTEEPATTASRSPETTISGMRDGAKDDNATSSTELTTDVKGVFTPGASPPRTSTAVPGRNTLSLLLDACVNLRALSPAQSYWGLLTSPKGPYNISPDAENYHMYLRLLRVQRASRAASELVLDLHKDPELRRNAGAVWNLQPKTFRIAMSCCVRDKNNQSVLENATSILETMKRALPTSDTKAVDMYVLLATGVAKRDYRAAILALRAMEQTMKQLKNWAQFGYGDVR
ncbi:MAG: hypothetical protein Q9218_004327, partial [Villophora microphyllina]